MNELQRQEMLDDADPLRYLMHVRNLSDNDVILPPQPHSVRNETLELSFSGTGALAPVCISLAVDASPGCGGMAWPAGSVLASYLVHQGLDSLKGKTVLELGSGTGLVGLVAAKLGAKVFITDQAPLLETMLKNVALNQLDMDVSVLELNWGGSIPAVIQTKRIDIILAADCVYFEPAFPLLVQTLSELVNSLPIEVLFCYKKRRKADKRFFTMLKKEFAWVLDDPARAVYSRESISLLRLTKLHNFQVEDR